MGKSLSPSEIEKTLGLKKPLPAWRNRRNWLLVAALLLGGVLIGSWWLNTQDKNLYRYRTQEARRGTLTVSVIAMGNLRPVTTVEVGSELSGIVRSVEVDYEDHVKKGQVLAKLDSATLKAREVQSSAALVSAKARRKQVQATVEETFKKLERLKALHLGKALAQQDLDSAEAAFKRAQADEEMALAEIANAKAALLTNQVNLAKAVIRSPINGIVLNRNVESGQTVAASLQSPILFILAEDLARMELSVNVDEADVGQVKVGQQASFSVAAYPKRSFPASITAVRSASQNTDGVVTYETLLRVDNSELMLRPGMTATAVITVYTVENALLVPNTALRFRPPSAEKPTPGSGGGVLSMLFRGRPRNKPAISLQNGKGSDNQQHLWTLRDGIPVVIPITVGLSDENLTEIITGDVKAGLPLVVETLRSDK